MALNLAEFCLGLRRIVWERDEKEKQKKWLTMVPMQNFVERFKCGKSGSSFESLRYEIQLMSHSQSLRGSRGDLDERRKRSLRRAVFKNSTMARVGWPDLRRTFGASDYRTTTKGRMSVTDRKAASEDKERWWSTRNQSALRLSNKAGLLPYADWGFKNTKIFNFLGAFQRKYEILGMSRSPEAKYEN
ncbi:hypothetical protein B0H13DRAFT_1899272 [Mycena leptocephala]|nr:hypothetical protein B0H13DRAFT_1899272 [Mycena leptocephala]